MRAAATAGLDVALGVEEKRRMFSQSLGTMADVRGAPQLSQRPKGAVGAGGAWTYTARRATRARRAPRPCPPGRGAPGPPGGGGATTNGANHSLADLGMGAGQHALRRVVRACIMYDNEEDK